MLCSNGIRLWLLTGVAALGAAGLAGCGHESARTATRPAPPPIIAPPAVAKPPVVVEIPRGERPFSTEVGLASWYGKSGRPAANGEFFDQDGLTAASRTLPLGSVARVTNLVTGQAAVVRINDRGPFVPGRILDLSLGAAKATGLYRLGVAKVKVEAYATDGVVLGAGRWCVQIGAFANPNEALQLKTDLIRRYGTTVKVISFKGDTGTWVRLTPLVPDKERVEEMAAKVRVTDAGVQAYVTRTN